jgi:hypothetical protein
LNEERDAEDTRELIVNKDSRRKSDFRFLKIFLYLLTIC